MNSSRVEEVAALRAQKKLDRKAEEEANLAQAEAESRAHEANMARIAKKWLALPRRKAANQHRLQKNRLQKNRLQRLRWPKSLSL